MASTPAYSEWHVLDARAIWVKELAGALATQVKVHGWIPHISWTGHWRQLEHDDVHANPLLNLRHFPLQRGFARWPLRVVLNTGRKIVQRLRRQTTHESQTVLMCVSPHYAAVAEFWKGPVVYYMSDLYYAWGENPDYVNYHDRRMCQRADLVCPVSERGQEYLIEKAHCPEAKIAISPMATRAANILSSPQLEPGPLPVLIQDLPRPIIGIIGNLAKNTDWLMLEQAVSLLPAFSWVFVGSTEMPVPNETYLQARQRLLQQGGRLRFLGPKPYHELAEYARSFDLALLPYRKIEPTYSGSSTRFYEHLAACRPMYATHGFAELLTKEPLVHLVQSAEDFANQVNKLAAQSMSDGVETARWQASQHETWEARAQAMQTELTSRLR